MSKDTVGKHKDFGIQEVYHGLWNVEKIGRQCYYY